jgi:hypothetical protein
MPSPAAQTCAFATGSRVRASYTKKEVRILGNDSMPLAGGRACLDPFEYDAGCGASIVGSAIAWPATSCGTAPIAVPAGVDPKWNHTASSDATARIAPTARTDTICVERRMIRPTRYSMYPIATWAVVVFQLPDGLGRARMARCVTCPGAETDASGSQRGAHGG